MKQLEAESEALYLDLAGVARTFASGPGLRYAAAAEREDMAQNLYRGVERLRVDLEKRGASARAAASLAVQAIDDQEVST